MAKHKDILFVHNYYEQTLGVMQISAVLKQNGFTTDVAIGPKEHILGEVLAKKPRVVGFYCTTGFHHKNIAIAKEIKKLLGKKILTILGGPHPTFVPGVINEEGVDVICRGEGEYAVLELLTALKKNRDYSKIKNLIVKKKGEIHQNEIRQLCDLDKLPPVDRELYKNIPFIYKHKRQEVMLGRGCPFNCTFCSTHAYRQLYQGKGMYMRFRTVEKAIRDLVDIKIRYNPSCFFFHDDTFVVNRTYCRQFLEEYREKINLPFACLIRADLATDETIKLLKDSGCYLVSYGIESGNETLRNNVLKKRLTNKQILNCARLLKKYKVPCATFNMIGLPDETIKKVWDTVNLNIKARPDWAWFSVYQTLPQTELAQYALDKGYLRMVDVSQSDATFHENSIILRNNKEGKMVIRLKNNANLVIRFPFLAPLVKNLMMKLPLDPLYTLMDKFLYYTCYYSRLTYKIGLLENLRSAFFISRHMKEFG